MDSALQLKKEYDEGMKYDYEHVKKMHNSSELLNTLTSEFSKKSLFPIWRIIALSEIPYTRELEYTKELIAYIVDTYTTPEGFSITGQTNDILPCYNSMLIEAFSKLGYADEPFVANAVNWIKKFQVFDRNSKTEWTGKGIKKYGGCMENTPCYIGIVKSLKALIYYNENLKNKDDDVNALISKGMNYILGHNLYLRMSKHEPITNHILDIAYPQSYHLNIVELLDIAYMTNNINHTAVKSALKWVIEKRKKEGFWKINYIYKSHGFISFDKRGTKADWVSYLFDKYISEIDSG